MAQVNVQGIDEFGNLVVKVARFEDDGLTAARRARLYEAAPHLLLLCEVVSKRLHLELESKSDELFPGRALIDDLDNAIAAAR